MVLKQGETHKYLRRIASHRVRLYICVHAHVYVCNLRNLPVEYSMC